MISNSSATGEYGAVAVEFGLMFLILTFLLSGVADLASSYQTKRDISDAVRAGARAGAQACIADVTCTDGNPNDADHRIQSTIQEFLGGRTTSVRKLTVYRAAAGSDIVPSSCLTATIGAAGVCNVTTLPFGADGSANALNVDEWKSEDRLRDEVNADYVGVEIVYEHRAPVGLFGVKRLLTARATFRLEPPVLSSQQLNPLATLNPLSPPDTSWWCDYTAGCGGGGGGPASPTVTGNGAG